ncbi:MAG TPA: hypothetical protein VFB62_23015, partial [Polyangiaceae bacterium]|nr:hypothetical protein [Polyangiaceae bacterium]
MTTTSAKALEALLFSGEYDRVVEATAHQTDPRMLPALVGALALSGRLDEAESAFRSMTPATPDELIQARFFVIAGLCHAGQVGKALRRARESVSDRGVAGAASRFWIWQGLALVRFFEGRFARSRRFARRALAAAVEASFPYARLLALDLLAHVLVETGEIHAGMRVLAQAEQLAQALGYEANRVTLHTARMVFQLRYLLLPLGAAVAQAREALADSSVSYFTRRNGLLELAMALALGGDGRAARAELNEAHEIALPGSDRRGRTRISIAHATLAALSQGPEAAAQTLDEAWSTAGEQLTLAAEIAFVDVFFVGATARTREGLAAVARASGVARAQLAAAVLHGEALPVASRIEDGLSRILVACQRASTEARLGQILDTQLLGLTPWALG